MIFGTTIHSVALSCLPYSQSSLMLMPVSPFSVKSWRLESVDKQAAVILGFGQRRKPGRPFLVEGALKTRTMKRRSVSRRITVELLETTLMWAHVVQTAKLFTVPVTHSPSLPCGLWPRCWTCADWGKLWGANEASSVRGYHSNTSPGSLPLQQADCVSLICIMGPSKAASLQFSSSRLFYICLLLCVPVLAEAQLMQNIRPVKPPVYI